MTRGQKGCFVYATDSETREYLQAFVPVGSDVEQTDTMLKDVHLQGLQLPIVARQQAEPFVRHVPIYDLSIAAGEFSDMQIAEDAEFWVELPDFVRASPDLFVSQVLGESMNRRIPNRAWCLFRANPGGTRQGKIVIVQHRSIEDPDHGGSFTIKLYQSEKVKEYGEFVNERIVLKPQTNAFGYKDIVLEDELADIKVIGEFLSVL